MVLNSLSKAYAITSYVINTSTIVEVPKDFCLTGGGYTSTNTTILVAELHTKYSCCRNGI
jgi:hypothetical protein